MARYIVFFRDPESRVDSCARIVSAPGVTVLDQASDRALLVEAPAESIDAIRQEVDHGVVIEKETTHPRPGPHKYRVQP